MAKRKVNTDLIMCDGFWQPDTKGQKIRGVLLTMNMVEDRLQKGLRPLYVLAVLDDAPGAIFLEKEPVKLKRGQVVGVNSSHKIDVAMRKLGGVEKVVGHEIEITYEGKERIEKTGHDLKTYTIEWDDEVNKEFRDRCVRPDPVAPRAAPQAAQGDGEIPF